jgi:hypothetical protein
MSEVYQFNPTVNPTINEDNMYATMTSVVIAGKPSEFWQLNAPMSPDTLVTMIVQVYFMPMTTQGVQLAEGTLIGNAPVSVTLNSPKLPQKSSPGTTLTGTTTTVTDPTGEAAIEFILNGPHGGQAVICITVGTETYEYQPKFL